MAFMLAAKSQAPNKYQVECADEFDSSGVNIRAIPAKSMLQKAMARMVAQDKPANFKSPNKSTRANSVVE